MDLPASALGRLRVVVTDVPAAATVISKVTLGRVEGGITWLGGWFRTSTIGGSTEKDRALLQCAESTGTGEGTLLHCRALPALLRPGPAECAEHLLNSFHAKRAYLGSGSVF